MNPVKKVAAIHDISCYGRASLTSIISIISALGAQVCPIPTAVLSTHTDGFGKPVIQDLSSFSDKLIEHWKMLNIKMDAIYSGYLANPDQVELIKKVINNFKTNKTIILVDPVMGDCGKLYSGIDNSMVTAMKSLIKEADIITPNVTEAAFLLGKHYDINNIYYDFKEWAYSLSEFGVNNVIITSVPSLKGEGYIDTIIYNKDKNLFDRITNKKQGGHYPGTGDAFASVLLGNLLKDMNIKDAAQKSCNFIELCISESSKYNYPNNEGVLLEKLLYKLIV